MRENHWPMKLDHCTLPSTAAVAMCAALCAARAGALEQPMLKPIAISAHRAGGRVYAPDNSAPNIEHAAALGLNMIEVDLRSTSDGRLVLFHDYSVPRSLFVPHDASGQRLAFCKLTLAEITKLRYSSAVAERQWRDLGIVDADATIERYKDRLNFHLDVKDTPAARVLKLIADHGVADRVIVMCPKLDYLSAIKRANPKVVVEWTQNTLGRYEKDGKWVFYPMERQIEEYQRAMKALRGIGGEMLCTKGLTPAKVRVCHEYGIAVRPSAGHVKATNGERFLRMGVDGILGDDPEAVTACVKRVLGEAYVPRQGMTVAEIFGR